LDELEGPIELFSESLGFESAGSAPMTDLDAIPICAYPPAELKEADKSSTSEAGVCALPLSDVLLIIPLLEELAGKL
jgi:hypothetical protein